jgi:hypothetical protein
MIPIAKTQTLLLLICSAKGTGGALAIVLGTALLSMHKASICTKVFKTQTVSFTAGELHVGREILLFPPPTVRGVTWSVA